MNELARLVPFIFNAQACRITDKDGNPWFLAKDVAKVLEIRNYREMIRHYPENEKSHVICAVSSTDITYRRCDVSSKHLTSAECGVGSTDTTFSKSRARRTQKYLIINEAGVMRLILKSRKPNAWEFKERIILYPTSGRRA